MEETQNRKEIPNQNIQQQGRNMDFSFRVKIEPHKFIRQVKAESKKEQNSAFSNETRDIQITLGQTNIQQAHLSAIKRLDLKMQKAENILCSILQAQNDTNNDNFHLFSNIRCSSESSQQQPQPQSEIKLQQIINEKKEPPKPSKKPVVERDRTTYRVSVLIKDQETSQFVELDFTHPNVYQNEILILRSFNQYNREAMNIFRLSNLRIGEQKIHFKSIKKITIFPFTLKKSQFQIELIHSNGRIVFGAELKRHLYFLPEHYIWFAKIINAKLMGLGFDMGKSGQMLNNNVNMGWSGTYAQGFIFKKSKYLKNWKKRYVVINSEGLFSYKQRTENYTVYVPMEQVRIISTEFDLHEKNLVIRLQTEQIKIEFAIPIQDFCVKIQTNWLFGFYRLLMQHKHHIKIA